MTAVTPVSVSVTLVRATFLVAVVARRTSVMAFVIARRSLRRQRREVVAAAFLGGLRIGVLGLDLRLGDLKRDPLVLVASLAGLRVLLLLSLVAVVVGDEWTVLGAVGRRVDETFVVVFRNRFELEETGSSSKLDARDSNTRHYPWSGNKCGKEAIRKPKKSCITYILFRF